MERNWKRAAWPSIVVLTSLAVAAVVIVPALRGQRERPVEVSPAAADREITALPTSSWNRGDASMAALMRGYLRLDPDGCLVSDFGGSRTELIWPQNWTTRSAADGKLQVVDDEGQVVVAEGQLFSTGGGVTGQRPIAGATTCVHDPAHAWTIQGGMVPAPIPSR
jgi:hypothetical protein